MRVLLAIDGMHPRDGGPPVVVSGSAQALQAHGADVTVLTTCRPGDEDAVRAAWKSTWDEGVTLAFCAAPGAGALLTGRSLPADVRRAIDVTDVVHLHGLWGPLYVMIARYAARTGKPYFISTHGILDHRAMHRTQFKWLKKRLAVAVLDLRSVLRDAAAVIFGSETEARESWGMPRDATAAFIPNGVAADVARSPISAEARDRVRQVAPQFFGWSRSLLVYCRVHPEKGLDMLVKAFNAVAAEFPGTGLLIAGLRQDEDFQREVETLIETGGHAEQIVLTTELTGSASHFIYSLCDIFVLPSHAEGFSVSLVEALAHGMPCLITTFCHVPSVQTEGVGLVVDPNPAALERGLRTLLALDDGERAAMGARARALFEARYTWDKVAETLMTTYAAARREREGAPA